MLDESFVVKLTKNILKRFEQEIDEGVLFLYNVETDELWTGNESSNDLIRLVNGERTLKDIYLLLMPLFEGYEYSVLKKSFDSIISDLINKDFLEILSEQVI